MLVYLVFWPDRLEPSDENDPDRFIIVLIEVRLVFFVFQIQTFIGTENHIKYE